MPSSARGTFFTEVGHTEGLPLPWIGWRRFYCTSGWMCPSVSVVLSRSSMVEVMASYEVLSKESPDSGSMPNNNSTSLRTLTSMDFKLSASHPFMYAPQTSTPLITFPIYKDPFESSFINFFARAFRFIHFQTKILIQRSS